MDPTQSKALASQADRAPTILKLPRVQQFIERIVAGDKFDDAAKAAGLRLKRARNIMTDPAVRKHYFRQMEVINESERARNILLRRTLRDRGIEKDAPAALAKVALEAARQLDGDDGNGSSTTVNVNNVIAGYVIDLRGEVEGPRVIGNRSANGAKPLINHDDVTDADG